MHSGFLWMNTFLHPRSNSREIKMMFGKVGNLGLFKCNKKLMTSPFYEGQSYLNPTTVWDRSTPVPEARILRGVLGTPQKRVAPRQWLVGANNRCGDSCGRAHQNRVRLGH